MRLFSEFVLLYFIFAILGWIMEVSLKYIQYHRFINRGFLIGPYCPIYGWGVVGVTILVGGLIGRKGTIAETFWAGFVICGALEYFTSYYMEKMFHARWWDYSSKPMNLNGRIWIGNLILFGLASLVIVRFIAPHYFNWADTLNADLLNSIALVIIILMIVDYSVSHFLMSLVKKQIDQSDKDNTEEISRQVRLLLKDHSLLERRILTAYPDFKALPERLKKDYVKAKKEYQKTRDNFKKELNKRFEKDFDEKRLEAIKSDLKVKKERLEALGKHFRRDI